MLLLVIGVHELLEPSSCRQCRVEEAKGALGCSCRCIAKLDLVELGQERLAVINVGLAMIVLFNGVGYLLVVLEVQLYKAILVLKIFCVILKDIVLPVSSLDSVVRRLANLILLSISLLFRERTNISISLLQVATRQWLLLSCRLGQ